MEEMVMLEKVEKYLNGLLSNEEKEEIELLLKSDANFERQFNDTVLFLKNINDYADVVRFKKSLNRYIPKKENNLGKVLDLWHAHKKTMAVAASVAILFSSISGAILYNSLYQRNGNPSLKPLVEKIREQDNRFKNLKIQVDKMATDQKPRLESNFRATGFLFDVNNNLVLTNAHVLDEAPNHVVIENADGNQFEAIAVYKNFAEDIAVLKIIDSNFKQLPSLPLSLRKTNFELGEEVFTLGYPKQEIVYGEGYVSAQNGFNMDSSFCQLSLSANEGSSGTPVISSTGDLIGMIAAKETNAQGVVFATKAKFIQKAIDSIKKTDGFESAKFTGTNQSQKYSRTNQIKKIGNYVFMIKGN